MSVILRMSQFIVKSVMQVIVRVSKKHWISLQIGLKNGSYLYQLASVTYSLLVTLAPVSYTHLTLPTNREV